MSNRDAHVTSGNIKENVMDVGPERKKAMAFQKGTPLGVRKTKQRGINRQEWTEDHKIEWNNTMVIDRAEGTLSRRVKESLHIVKEKVTTNEYEGLRLSAVRKSLFI